MSKLNGANIPLVNHGRICDPLEETHAPLFRTKVSTKVFWPDREFLTFEEYLVWWREMPWDDNLPLPCELDFPFFLHGKSEVTRSWVAVKRLPKAQERDNRAEILIQNISDICWIAGIKLPLHHLRGLPYEEVRPFWKEYCEMVMKGRLRVPDLGIYDLVDGREARLSPDLHPEAPDHIIQFLYSARRALPLNLKFKTPEEVLARLGALFTPPDPSIQYYGRRDVIEFVNSVFETGPAKHSTIMVQSTKGTIEFTRAMGGFNAGVKYFASIPGGRKMEPDTVPVGYSELVNELAEKAKYNSATYYSALLTSLDMVENMRENGFLPRVYFDQIPERGKDRIPGIGEFPVAIIARHIGSHLSAHMKRIFPTTVGCFEPSVLNGEWKESGDAKGGTDSAHFGPAREALARVCHFVLPEDNIKKRIIKLAPYLIGPHEVLWNDEQRSEAGIYHLEDEEPIPPDYAKGKSEKWKTIMESTYYGLLAKGGRALGQRHTGWMGDTPIGITYQLGHPKSPPTFTHLLAARKKRIDNTLVTCRGIHMMYGFAQCILMLLTRMPFYKNPTIHPNSHIETGDDNGLCETIDAILRAHKEKFRTGMIPHEHDKAFLSKVGMILGERLMMDKGGKYLDNIPFFPARVLFPSERKADDFITIPLAVKSYLNKFDDEGFKERIWCYVYRLNKGKYDELVERGVPVSRGPSPLIEYKHPGERELPPLDRNYLGIYKLNTPLDSFNVRDVINYAEDLKVDEHHYPDEGGYQTQEWSLERVVGTVSAYCSNPYKPGKPNTAPPTTVDNIVDNWLEFCRGSTHMSQRLWWDFKYHPSYVYMRMHLGLDVSDCFSIEEKYHLHKDQEPLIESTSKNILAPQMDILAAIRGTVPPVVKWSRLDYYGRNRTVCFVDLANVLGPARYRSCKTIEDAIRETPPLMAYDTVVFVREFSLQDIAVTGAHKAWLMVGPPTKGTADRDIRYLIGVIVGREWNVEENLTILTNDRKRDFIPALLKEFPGVNVIHTEEKPKGQYQKELPLLQLRRDIRREMVERCRAINAEGSGHNDWRSLEKQIHTYANGKLMNMSLPTKVKIETFFARWLEVLENKGIQAALRFQIKGQRHRGHR